MKQPDFSEDCAQLDILVESFGRVNYGSHLLDRKGITDFVSYDNAHTLMGWEVFPIETSPDYLSRLQYKSSVQTSPTFHKGTFNLEDISDTFLDTRAWKKGMIWINGQNLGRFWEVGPQHTLYVPSVWLKKGKNEIVLLDMEGPQREKKIKKLYKKEWKLHNWKELLSKTEKRPLLKGLNSPII